MLGFRKFILRGNVVDLAVAVVIGAAFGAVVTALVKDLITPLIGAFGGVPDFSGVYFSINSSKFMVGDFINAVLSFVIIAAVIYFLVVVPLGKLIDRVSPPAAVATRECPFCLSKIPVKATRCAFCTSEVTPQKDVEEEGQIAGPVDQTARRPT
jgi:large conductance mechanosensitive channel